MGKKFRYRYICDKSICYVNPFGAIKFHRLYPGNALYGKENVIVRLSLPKDMKLTHRVGDEFASTSDTTQLISLDPVVLVRFNGTYKIDAELTEEWRKYNASVQQGTGLYPWPDKVLSKRDLVCSDKKFGYVTRDQFILMHSFEDKLWQFKSLPKTFTEMCQKITSPSMYPVLYKSAIEDIHETIDKLKKNANQDPEYLESLKHASDEELVDTLGKTCMYLGPNGSIRSCNEVLSEFSWALKDLSKKIEISEKFKMYADDLNLKVSGVCNV